MKLIKAFIHHVRTPDVIQTLTDAGFRNLTLQDVRGTLKPLPRWGSRPMKSAPVNGLPGSVLKISGTQ